MNSQLFWRAGIYGRVRFIFSRFNGLVIPWEQLMPKLGEFSGRMDVSPKAFGLAINRPRISVPRFSRQFQLYDVLSAGIAAVFCSKGPT